MKSWNNLSEKISLLAGGKGFFLGFTIASVVWTVLGVLGIDPQFGAFTLALSILAIYLVIFLQNSQNREQEKFQEWLKDDLRTTKRIEGKINAILKASKSSKKGT